jgi:uncharacterized protein (TIGR03437 family)
MRTEVRTRRRSSPAGLDCHALSTGGSEAAAGAEDGQILRIVIPRTSLPVSVFFARSPEEKWGQGEVLYAGGSSGSIAGLLQVNVRVPPNAGSGDKVAFALIIGDRDPAAVEVSG